MEFPTFSVYMPYYIADIRTTCIHHFSSTACPALQNLLGPSQTPRRPNAIAPRGNPSPSPSRFNELPFVLGHVVAVGHAGHGAQDVEAGPADVTEVTELLGKSWALECVVSEEALMVGSLSGVLKLMSELLKQLLSFTSATSSGRLKVISTHYRYINTGLEHLRR